MQITEGLFSRMVLQRTRTDKTRAAFAGTCQAPGTVQARVRTNGRTLRGWNFKKVGQAKGRRLQGRIDGLPVGGPYDIDLRIVDKGQAVDELSVSDVLVGDVWILAGQSNMQGLGWLVDKCKPIDQVRAFYMYDEWDVAVDPLHTTWCAVDPVHGGNPDAPRVQPNRFKGVGPGVAFGQDLHKRTGVPQGLIACAHGGTNMDQWDPRSKKAKGQSLYGAMYRRFKKNGGAVAGVFWYQGCADSQPDKAPCYTQKMKKLVRAMRRDFKDPRLPIVTVQISRTTRLGDPQWWTSIREQQRCLPKHINNLAVVPAVDLPLTDTVHLSGQAQNILGKRCAEAMQVLREGRKAGLPSIDVRDITVKPNPISKMADIIVRFKNVAGSLKAPGLPTGFDLETITAGDRFYRVDLDGDKAILHMQCGLDMADGRLYYGRDYDPYCNITDEAGRSIPAFGPLPVRPTQLRAITPFINSLRISDIFPGADIRKLACPDSLKLHPHRFSGLFCDRHLELADAGQALVYYAFDFHCSQPMKLNLLLGYDGPAKAWCDGRQIFCDPKGTNPATPDDAAITFAAKEGTHQILVALGSRGAAWGVYLRLERRDVSKAALRRNPHEIIMPVIEG